MARILIQRSLFVIETSPPISAHTYKTVTIAKEDKESILREIKENFDIDEKSLFKDFYGFADVNKADSNMPFSFSSPDACFSSGNIAYQQNRHDAAIQHYSKAIKLKLIFLKLIITGEPLMPPSKIIKKRSGIIQISLKP